MRVPFLLGFVLFCAGLLHAQPARLDECNVVWTSQSKHAGESMPCGGGSIGLNVWVEKDELLIYFGRSGQFDENNALLKSGRLRISFPENPFRSGFQQTLDLKTGSVRIEGRAGNQRTEFLIWVDVFHPQIHIESKSSTPIQLTATYESWRFEDRPGKGKANQANSWKWATGYDIRTRKDSMSFEGNRIVFLHRNEGLTVFDATVSQQGLDSVKHLIPDPLRGLSFGGCLEGKGFLPAGNTSGRYADTDFRGWSIRSAKARKRHEIRITLHTEQVDTTGKWRAGLEQAIRTERRQARRQTLDWWRAFWERSFIFTGKEGAGEEETDVQMGRNYQRFRYLLACNYYGAYPTKFNGGLFTVDPVYTDTSNHFTPDFRNWGGGTHTAQNQRLVYFPFLRTGDLDGMHPQFDFYRKLLPVAELRSRVYWGHEGACFTEQMEHFGLPNIAEYGLKRPPNFDKGLEYNAWLEYEWDTVLEFCLMILETERYGGQNIQEYLPLIRSCLRFFDQHYQYLARQRGNKALDGKGQLVLYPGSGGETYKMANNATSTIAALRTVTERLLDLPDAYLDAAARSSLDSFRRRIPPISFTSVDGHPAIAPARLWERVNNVESMQLYPVFPWGMYGLGRPGLDTARNTYRYDTLAIKFRSHVGWKQDNIFSARLGLKEEALRLNRLKLQSSGRRFPAFWGPGFDWTPDHNWGGSGMIGLQEMLLQTPGRQLLLFPAWPKGLDVHFKLHAPYQTTVEAVLKNGKLEKLIVLPESRKQDLTNMLDQPQ